MYLSELLQKPILSLYEGEILGNISKVYFNKSKCKVKAFEIIVNDDLIYMLRSKHIYTIGKNAITIKNKQHLLLSLNEDKTELLQLPINAKVYSLQGEFLGNVKDYSLTEKFDIENIVLDNQQLISIKELASCSNNSLVVYYSQPHVNISAFRYRIKNKNNLESKVKVLPKLFSSFNKIASHTSTKKENFIVGRICTRDIVDGQHNLIIKQNSTITDEIIALASSKNKLQELMKYSKIK